MTITAFQSDAFQSDAFQQYGEGTVGLVCFLRKLSGVSKFYDTFLQDGVSLRTLEYSAPLGVCTLTPRVGGISMDFIDDPIWGTYEIGYSVEQPDFTFTINQDPIG